MIKSPIGLSLFAASLCLVASAASAASGIGAVTQAEYRGASASPVGNQTAHPIHFQDAVFARDTVRTGASGSTALTFLDQTILEIGAGAELTLDDFVYDPATTVGAGEISFAVGAFRYVGGRMTTEENVRLLTPTATMAIRGTELVIYVWDDGTTEVNVVSGAVKVSALQGGAGRLVMSGMRITVLPTRILKVAPARDLPAGLAALSLPDIQIERSTDDAGDAGKSGGPAGDGRKPGSRPKAGSGPQPGGGSTGPSTSP